MWKTLIYGLLASALLSGAAYAESLGGLAGYWQGTGRVVLESGHEQVKCTATNKASANGAELRMSWRCASGSFNIYVIGQLQVNGSVLSGTWEERTYNVSGTVSGRVSPELVTAHITGGGFTGTITIETRGSVQRVVFTPREGGVKGVTVTLHK